MSFTQLSEFQIYLENTSGCFEPGENVFGTIKLGINGGNFLEIDSLKLQFYGSAKIKSQNQEVSF